MKFHSCKLTLNVSLCLKSIHLFSLLKIVELANEIFEHFKLVSFFNR